MLNAANYWRVNLKKQAVIFFGRDNKLEDVEMLSYAV